MSVALLSLVRVIVGLLIVPIDYVLRRIFGIREFTDDPECCLRISLSKAREKVVLSDGISIDAGEMVGEIHLWNERIPPMPSTGPDLKWGISFQKKMVYSLRQLARFIRQSPDFRHVRAFRGRMGMKEKAGLDMVSRVSARFGLQVVFEGMPTNVCPKIPPKPESCGLGTEGGRSIARPLGRFFKAIGWFFDNLYSTGLILIYNPASLRGKSFWTFERPEMWISAASLMERYGDRRDLCESSSARL